jgi:hypothetical protein
MAEKTLQEEKVQLLEQYKRVKKLERQGKRRETRIENAQQHFQQQANEHFSLVYTTLQLGLKTQPSPQPAPVCQVDVNSKASTRRSISSKEPLPLYLPLPREPLACPHPQQHPMPMPRISTPPSKRPTSLLMFGKPSSRPSSSSPHSSKMDKSLDVTEYPAPVNSPVTFSAPRPLPLSKEEKVIDAPSINHHNNTSTDRSIIPLPAKQQASEVVTTASVVSTFQGNDICHLRCPATVPEFKEGKMIDVSGINCQSVNPPC